MAIALAECPPIPGRTEIRGYLGFAESVSMIDQTGMAPVPMRLTGALARVFQLVHLPRKLAFRIAKGARILMVAGVYRRRRRLFRKLSRQFTGRSFIDRDKGYALLAPDSISGTNEVISACQEIHRRFERHSKMADQSVSKPFFVNIMQRAELDNHPELLEYALSDPIVDAVASYLGSMPLLRGMGVYVSAENETTVSSQMFHCDYDDLRQVKCFINVHEVSDEEGPFTFVPADVSARIRTRLAHGWRGGRLSDEDILGLCEPDDIIRLTGPAGSGGMIDTTNCLHFGSRSRQGRRVVFMFQYVTYPNIGVAHSENAHEEGRPLYRLPIDAIGDDPLKRSLLAP